MLSAYDKANMTIILGGHGNWFSAKLLRLIAEADPTNTARLRLAFPEEVEAFEAWLLGEKRVAVQDRQIEHSTGVGVTGAK